MLHDTEVFLFFSNARFCLLQVIYSLSSFASSDVTSKFEIDARRGVIRTLAPLDRERTSSFTIPVVARDNGSVPSQTQCTVIVHVSDVNDNAPVVDVHTYSDEDATTALVPGESRSLYILSSFLEILTVFRNVAITTRMCSDI